MVRFITGKSGLGVVWGILLGTALAVAVTACVDAQQRADGFASGEGGAWADLPASPGMPKGTKCWVWTTAPSNLAVGGPVCKFPDPEGQWCQFLDIDKDDIDKRRRDGQ